MNLTLAHNTLASRLGDTVYATDTVIPDGVRFSKVLRDNYLYQAMISLYRDTLKELTGLPKVQREAILSRMFPNVTRETTITLGGGTQIGNGITAHYVYEFALNYLYLMKSRLEADIGNGIIEEFPLPVRTIDESNKKVNSRIKQRPDSFLQWYQNNAMQIEGKLYHYGQDIQGSNVLLYGISLPIHPTTQAPTDELDIEELYIGSVISRAVYYALQDSQGEITTSLAQTLRSE